MNTLNSFLHLFLAYMVSVKLGTIFFFYGEMDIFPIPPPMTANILNCIFHFHYTLNTICKSAFLCLFWLLTCLVFSEISGSEESLKQGTSLPFCLSSPSITIV